MSTRLGRAITAALVLMMVGVLAILGVQTIFAQSAPADGLRADIVKAEIPSDRKPVVTFSLTDASGSPLTLEQMDANSVRFALTRVEKDAQTGYGRLLNYVVTSATGRSYTFEGEDTKAALARASQAGYDSGGVFTSLGNGSYTYKFSFALPLNYDVDATQRVAMQATRNARQWVGNDFYDWKPNGQVAQAVTSVTNKACDSCHDLLAAHGGQRYEVQLCATCHTEQTTDPETGRTVDFKVMVHKIHRGENLPSVAEGKMPYYIVGFHQSVADFSEVAFPRDVRQCTACHTGPAADNYKTKPSAAACGACHDNVDFATGAGHPAGAQPDSACATCHPADGPEFGASVTGAHTIPERSSQLRGVTFNLLGVSNTGPGQTPTVAFNIKDKQGAAIDPAEMARLGFNLAGPTYDYQFVRGEAALGKVKVVSPDRYEYTFVDPLPAWAGNAWTVQIEGYMTTQVKGPSGLPVRGADGKPLAVRDAGFDQSLDFAVTGDIAWPRKTIVTNQNCDQCHGQLYLHGGNRQNVENCVICHNPNATDAAVRPADAGAPVTIDFPVMIHKIHTGEELNQKPYIIYGYRGSVNEFDTVLYPTDRRVCQNCHVPQSQLPEFLHQGAQPVVVSQNGKVLSSTPPLAAICTACHDSAQAVSHAQSNTAPDGSESCVLCHASGQTAAVNVKHAVTWPVLGVQP